MILGIGTDLTSIERVRKAAGRPSFLSRVFSERELLYAGEKAERLAASWAGKEAVIKALRSGILQLPLAEIEILRREDGSPYIEPGEALQRVFREKGVKKAEISLSHEGEYALAFVVLEGEGT